MSGYDGPHEAEEKCPSPNTRRWEVVFNDSLRGDEEYVYVRVEIDGEGIGLLRLPDNEHVRFVRERLNHEPDA